jgi:hypothetical protein
MKKTLCAVLSMLFLFGCERRPAISPTEQVAITADCRQLILKFPENGNVWEIPTSAWPESVARLKPVLVRRYGGGIGILFHKFVSREDGIMITEPGYTPTNSSSVKHEKVSEGFYWYSISG